MCSPGAVLGKGLGRLPQLDMCGENGCWENSSTFINNLHVGKPNQGLATSESSLGPSAGGQILDSTSRSPGLCAPTWKER